jgi:type IV pilus assembly protein PilB
MATRQGLGDVLIEERVIAREQLNQAKRAAERLGSPLVAVLLEQGLVTEEALVEALHRRLELEIFDPVHTVVDLDAVREVPFEEANRYRLLPVQLQQRSGQRMLRVAMVDPLDAQAIEDIEFSTGCVVEAIIARPSHLADAIRHHYRGVVTKVIARARADEPTPGRGRRPFGGDLEKGQLNTTPVHRVQQAAATTQRVDALVSLLVRKGVITQDEYEEQLRVFLRPPEEES